MRSTIVALAALLLSTAILFVGGGLNAVLIPVRAGLEGFPTLVIGLLGTMAAVGMIVGCMHAPHLIQRVGHIRAFAVLAACTAIVALLHGLVLEPWVWLLLRIPTGYAFAGLATVIESWLNAGAGNRWRGQVMAVYMVIQLGTLTAGQLLLMTADPATLVLFAVVALAVTASLIPVGLTRAIMPGPLAEVRLRPVHLYRLSQSGSVGAVAVGLILGAFWALAPLYAQQLGLETSRIAIFMSVAVVCGAILQYPLGRLSDVIDRRRVIAIAGVAATAASLGLASIAARLPFGPTIFIGLFGAFAFTLYPLCVAHVNDHVTEGGFVEASSGLLLLYGIGSVIGPILAAGAMAVFGPSGLFLFIAAVSAVLVAFVLYRGVAQAPPPPEERGNFVVMPTSGTGGLDLDPRAGELAPEAVAPSAQEPESRAS